MIMIPVGCGLIELNDNSIPHSSAPQLEDQGGDCDNDDDPHCVIRQVFEVGE